MSDAVARVRAAAAANELVIEMREYPEDGGTPRHVFAITPSDLVAMIAATPAEFTK